MQRALAFVICTFYFVVWLWFDDCLFAPPIPRQWPWGLALLALIAWFSFRPAEKEMSPVAQRARIAERFVGAVILLQCKFSLWYGIYCYTHPGGLRLYDGRLTEYPEAPEEAQFRMLGHVVLVAVALVGFKLLLGRTSPSPGRMRFWEVILTLLRSVLMILLPCIAWGAGSFVEWWWGVAAGIGMGGVVLACHRIIERATHPGAGEPRVLPAE